MCGWNKERVYIVLPVNYLLNAGPICTYRAQHFGGRKIEVFFTNSTTNQFNNILLVFCSVTYTSTYRSK